MKVICCIPARYGSSRLPGKPLLKINEKTIIQLVYEQVMKVNNNTTVLDDIVVLTDDDRIMDEVSSFHGNAYKITQDCLNGTDRIIYYLMEKYSDYDLNELVVVNVQGDEPFIKPENIIKAVDNFFDNIDDEKMVCSTIHYDTQDENEIILKSRGKMVMDCNNNIIYCSRNVIPSNKVNNIIPNYDYSIHIGVFVYNAHYLINHYYNNNTRLQLTEDIEWMKIIEQGYHINSVCVDEQECGIDTNEDYLYLVNKYKV